MGIGGIGGCGGADDGDVEAEATEPTGGPVFDKGVEALTIGEVALVGVTGGGDGEGSAEPLFYLGEYGIVAFEGAEARAAERVGTHAEGGDGGGVEGGVGIVGRALGGAAGEAVEGLLRQAVAMVEVDKISLVRECAFGSGDGLEFAGSFGAGCADTALVLNGEITLP